MEKPPGYFRKGTRIFAKAERDLAAWIFRETRERGKIPKKRRAPRRPLGVFHLLCRTPEVRSDSLLMRRPPTLGSNQRVKTKKSLWSLLNCWKKKKTDFFDFYKLWCKMIQFASWVLCDDAQLIWTRVFWNSNRWITVHRSVLHSVSITDLAIDESREKVEGYANTRSWLNRTLFSSLIRIISASKQPNTHPCISIFRAHYDSWARRGKIERASRYAAKPTRLPSERR